AWRAPGAGGPRVPGAASGAASRLSPLGGRRTRLWPEALRTARAGAQLVRGRWILVAVLMSTVVMGAANEAVDRLDTLRITALGLPAGDTTQAIVFFGVVWFAMSALMLPVITLLGRRIDDMATRRATRLLAVLLATSSVGVLALSLGPWFAFAVGGWAVRDVATEVTFPLAEAVVNRHADSSVRATVISFLGQAESLGQVVGGVVLGVVAQLTTVPWALTAAAALLGVAALPYLVRRDVGV
ncbi:MAG TPA: hypothetical protein DEP66_04300, partial [Acidimicrobiaceae bacterium]|nr:hypothetical protein [Acidimicrobiaceae bacterium]